MRFNIPSPAILTALLAIASTATANSCTFSDPDGDLNGFNVNVDVWAENVVDIAGICGGLWDNLHNRGCDPSNTYCGGIEETHILEWRFTTVISCEHGNVEGAWYEATKNNFGAISCVG